MNNQMTLKEIAMISGVSIATASRFLSNPQVLKPSTRKKIENSLETFHERKPKVKSNLIAIVIPDISNQFFPMLLKGIESISRPQGYTLLLCNSEGSTANEEKILENLLSIDVAGIVFICSGNPSRLLQDIVKDNIIPIVFLDRTPDLPNTQTVTSGNFDGMYQSAKYLLSLGHRNILYVGGPDNLSTEQERYQGFLSAIEDTTQEMGITDRINASYSNETAFVMIKKMISSGDFPFTAICASNDLMAFGAYRAAISMRLGVPNDISIIGYDDVPTSELLRLTTIRQPFEEMGRTAMIQLSSFISDPFLPRQNLVLSTGIVLRDSCKAISIQ